MSELDIEDYPELMSWINKYIADTEYLLVHYPFGFTVESVQNKLLDMQEKINVAQARMKELEQAQEWISTEDTLPEHDNPILITDSCGWVAVGYYWPYENSVVEKKGKFYKCGDDWHNELFVTHWLPLPPQPKGE